MDQQLNCQGDERSDQRDQRQARAVGVVFGRAQGVAYFQPGRVAAKPGDYVIAKLDRAVDIGQVTCSVYLPQRQVAKMPRLIRRAREDDIAQHEALAEEEKKALKICEERIAAHGLPMRLIESHYTLDKRRLTFYFSADGRVDFRALVRDLARIFRCRIELRQVGVRDYARLVGGIGVCGRPLCCATFLHSFAPVSMRVAKDQGMALNPVKLSGLCDRLMCCLLYEYDVYKELAEGLPKVGQRVETPRGQAVVEGVNILAQTVDVAYEDGRQLTLSASELTEPAAVEVPIDKPARQKGEKNSDSPRGDEPGASPPVNNQSAKAPPAARNGSPRRRSNRRRGLGGRSRDNHRGTRR